MSAIKRSYRNDVIRFGSLAIALLVFFAGPHLIESDTAEDIDETISYVKASKIPVHVKGVVLSQLVRDKKFAQQNASAVSIATVKLPAVYWLSLLILLIGFGGPLILKYFENKKTSVAP